MQNKPVEEGSVERLADLPFFRRMVEREQQRYEEYRDAMSARGAEGSVLDESRVYGNEREGENDVGYEVY